MTYLLTCNLTLSSCGTPKISTASLGGGHDSATRLCIRFISEAKHFLSRGKVPCKKGADSLRESVTETRWQLGHHSVTRSEKYMMCDEVQGGLPTVMPILDACTWSIEFFHGASELKAVVPISL